MGRKTWVELNLRNKDERDLQVESDPSACCRSRNEVDLLQRELDDTTDRLVVSCLQRIELEKAVQTAADRIRDLEDRLGEPAPIRRSSTRTVSGNDIAVDVTERRSRPRLVAVPEPDAPTAIDDEPVDMAIEAPEEAVDVVVEDRSKADADNVYVFDDGDSVGEAFDEFFSAHDPHHEKIRRFLLG